MFYYGRKRMGGLPTVIVVCCWSHIVWGHAVKTIGAAQGKAGPIHTQAPSHDWPAKHARMKTREDKEQPGQQATRGSRSSQLSHSFFHPHHEVGAATVTCFVPWFLDLLFDLREYARSLPSRNTAKKSHTPLGAKTEAQSHPAKTKTEFHPARLYMKVSL